MHERAVGATHAAAGESHLRRQDDHAARLRLGDERLRRKVVHPQSAYEGATDDEKGQIRASLYVSSETVELAKHGRIQNKDLAIEVCAQDWQHKYEQIWAKTPKTP